MDMFDSNIYVQEATYKLMSISRRKCTIYEYSFELENITWKNDHVPWGDFIKCLHTGALAASSRIVALRYVMSQVSGIVKDDKLASELLQHTTAGGQAGKGETCYAGVSISEKGS